MKLLVLGSSNDDGDWFQGGLKRHEIVGVRLAEEFGEPVEVVAHSVWPNERMVAMVQRWLAEEEPDLVYLGMTTFPFAYESLPLRFQRILGRFGPWFGNAGLRFADSKRWAYNPVFRGVRRFGQATIGGDTHFTCDEVIERYSESIRLILRREGVCLVVKGPYGRGKPGLTAREHRRKEVKRLKVHGALERLCASLAVTYDGRGSPLWREYRAPAGTKVGDGMHSNAAGHALLADQLYPVVRDAWAAHLAVAGVRAS